MYTHYEINVDHMYVNVNFLCQATQILMSPNGLPIFQYHVIDGKTAILRNDIESIRDICNGVIVRALSKWMFPVIDYLIQFVKSSDVVTQTREC